MNMDEQQRAVLELLASLDDLETHLGGPEAPTPLATDPVPGASGELEDDVTPMEAAVRDRILARLGLPADPAPGTARSQADIDGDFLAIVETSLADVDTPLVAARRGGCSLPTKDIVVPALLAAGYEAEVEIEADLDIEGGRARLTILFELSPGVSADSVRAVRVGIRENDGSIRWAQVSRLGVAVVDDVPRAMLGRLELVIRQTP